MPSLISLSNKGPLEAELVSMLLRWLPEDITVHYEDLEGDRRKSLLRGLSQSLSQILPLLYSLLERHFTGAFNEASKQQFDAAKQHAAAVTATLNAVNAYAEWAPVPDLANYKLIDVCGFFLSSVDFRVHACEFFKLLSQRKRPNDESVNEFDGAMMNVFRILLNASGELLSKYGSSSEQMDEGELIFSESICESMVAFGSSFMQVTIEDEGALSQYVQQMMVYFQHYKFTLHISSLNFWLVILKDISSKTKTSTQAAEKMKNKLNLIINDDICASILDVCFRRMITKVVQSGTEVMDTWELWSSELDSRVGFSQYRSRLLELVRLAALHKPVIAAAKVSQRVEMTISAYVASSAPPPLKGQSLLENMQLGLETIIGAIFEEPNWLGNPEEVKFGLKSVLEGLLRELLGLKWTEPALAEVLGRYLDAFGPYLRCFPEAVGCVIDKLFQLLNSIPLAPEDSCATIAGHARLQICTSFLRIARASEKSILPHMKGIAETMTYLQGEGLLLRGEHNMIAEAILVMASSSGIQQQQEVLAWLLEPLSNQWTDSEWQRSYLYDPNGLKMLFSKSQIMWSIYHNVTFFEKALRRGGAKKAATEVSTSQHPMCSHLPWILPPLLRLVRSIHVLWSQVGSQSLPSEIRLAMTMSPSEQTSLLGEVASKPSKSQSGRLEYPSIEMDSGSNENTIRNWLKGVRDSCYNVLGLSIMAGEGFFLCVESSAFSAAVMENIQTMEFRHIRQLIHLVLIPLVKSCPPNLWEEWLEKTLYPLFMHCQQALSYSWAGLLRESRAKVPDQFGNQPGPDLNVEVMEEKLLRDLTREITLLFSLLALPARNKGIPSLEQLASIRRADPSSLKPLSSFSSTSLTAFVLGHKALAVPALQICREAFAWTDSGSVSKVVSFCGVVILLATATDDPELKGFVARDLLYAGIQALGVESNAFVCSDLLGLCREIFVYFSDKDPAPRQVLLSLPRARLEDLSALEEAVAKTTSAKEQKQHLRNFLVLASGNNLKAIVQQKTAAAITDVSARPRATSSAAAAGADDEPIGFAAIT
ncbi:ARM repeat superfamily protein isoform X2 [Wolffia australiana]